MFMSEVLPKGKRISGVHIPNVVPKLLSMHNQCAKQKQANMFLLSVCRRSHVAQGRLPLGTAWARLALNITSPQKHKVKVVFFQFDLKKVFLISILHQL